MKTEEFWAGTCEEWLNSGPFESREMAILEGRSAWPDRHFFIGRAGTYTPFTDDYVDLALEQEYCTVCDLCGSDAGDSWPGRVSKDAANAANAKIVAILNDLCGECTVFPVENCERIEAIAAAEAE